MYGRMQSEYLQPLVERVFGLMYRDGAFGNAPPEIAGRLFRVQYRSPIARSQKAVDVSAMDRYEAALVQEAAGTGKMEPARQLRMGQGCPQAGSVAGRSG